MRMLMVTVAAVVLAGCGDGDRQPTARASYASADGTLTITVLDPYARPATAGTMSTAGYFEIGADSMDTLVGARAAGFDAVELHTVTEEDGISRMRQVEGFDLVPGRLVALAPGGNHLMLMGPDGALREGDTIDVTLVFESGAEVAVPLPVERRAPDGHGGMDHSGH